MSRALTIAADPDDRLALSMGWINGEGDDGLEFDLVCGAGLGSGLVRVTVTKGDVRVVESFDIRDLVKEWVSQIEAEIKEEASDG